MLALVILLVARPVVDVRRGPGRARAAARARRALGGRPARRGARRARHLPGHRGRARAASASSTPCSSPSCSRRSCRARRSSRWRGASARRPPSRRCRGRWPRRGRSAGSGAEVLEHAVRAGDAIAGGACATSALPREAVVNVIVRGNEAIPPRGSTHPARRRPPARPAAPGDRGGGARARRPLDGRPRRPAAAPAPGDRPLARLLRAAAARPGAVEGDLARPAKVAGHGVVRAAAHPPRRCPARSSSSTTAATRSRARSSRSARARACAAGPSAGCASCTPTTTRRAWLQNVNGALATDLPRR